MLRNEAQFQKRLTLTIDWVREGKNDDGHDK